MWVHRMIMHAELKYAKHPSQIVMSTVNEMRSHFTPVEELDTRVFPHRNLPAVCIQISLPGSCCPNNPRGEVYV